MNRILLIAFLALATISACSALPSRDLRRRPRLDGRIVGGHTIDIREAPFQISLQQQQSGWHMCGGSIIGSRFILTAAHCTYGMTANQLSVRMGTSEYASGGVLQQVKKIHQNKKYDPSIIDYDFSVLELAADILFDETMQPIELPEYEEPVDDGLMLSVSGWGNTQNINESNKILRKASVPKVSHKDCDDAYVSYGGITERMLCAGFKQGGKDACQGDSGGPLYTNNTLVGVVSWGFGCAKPNYPGVYSRVAAVVDWISDIIN